MSLEKTIAHDLLSIGAVFLRPDEPFTWASGIKSPIYCDNRLTLTAPAVRTHVEEGLVASCVTTFKLARPKALSCSMEAPLPGIACTL